MKDLHMALGLRCLADSAVLIVGLAQAWSEVKTSRGFAGALSSSARLVLRLRGTKVTKPSISTGTTIKMAEKLLVEIENEGFIIRTGNGVKGHYDQ